VDRVRSSIDHVVSASELKIEGREATVFDRLSERPQLTRKVLCDVGPSLTFAKPQSRSWATISFLGFSFFMFHSEPKAGFNQPFPILLYFKFFRGSSCARA
jgi:hypothetical protein